MSLLQSWRKSGKQKSQDVLKSMSLARDFSVRPFRMNMLEPPIFSFINCLISEFFPLQFFFYSMYYSLLLFSFFLVKFFLYFLFLWLCIKNSEFDWSILLRKKISFPLLLLYIKIRFIRHSVIPRLLNKMHVQKEKA